MSDLLCCYSDPLQVIFSLAATPGIEENRVSILVYLVKNKVCANVLPFYFSSALARRGESKTEGISLKQYTVI